MTLNNITRFECAEFNHFNTKMIEYRSLNNTITNVKHRQA